MHVPDFPLRSFGRGAIVATAVLLTTSACSSGSSGSSDDDPPGLRLATVAFDEDNDGVREGLVTWRYDPEGRAVAEEFDEGADGSVEVRFGRVRSERTLRIERDVGANGTVEGATVLTVDAEGRLVSETRAASDDGFAAEDITHVIEGGRTVRIDIDEGADGSVDVVGRPRYDASGRIAGTDFDLDGDGVADNTLEVVREANGTVVRIEEDFGDDGGVDSVRILTYEEGPCDADDIANVATPIIRLCL